MLHAMHLIMHFIMYLKEEEKEMKKFLMGAIVVLLACGVFAADKTAKKDAAAGEEKGGGDKAKKTILMNFSKGDQFNNLGEKGEQALTEEHLTGKEKVRMKVKGTCGMFGLSKNVDWSKYNYVVFNAFVTGDKPWSGMMLIGDKASYAKWSQNYVETSLSLKPGENKEVHVGIEGLFSAYANRALDMTNIQVFQLYNDLPETFLGNFYLVYEEE